MGIPEPTPSYGLANGLVIHADVDEDLVYRMTRAISSVDLPRLRRRFPAHRERGVRGRARQRGRCA